MRIQNEMVIKARFVELLHALGAFEEAFTRIEQIMDAPDRTGMVSASSETVELSNNIAWSVANARLEQIKELQSARPFWAHMQMELNARKSAIRAGALKARRLSALPDVLIKTTRPYLTDVMPWYGGDLIPILGEGVMTKSIKEARVLRLNILKKPGYFSILWSVRDIGVRVALPRHQKWQGRF